MKVVVSYPGTSQHAQQTARAFYEKHALAAFVTGLALDERNVVRRLSETFFPAHLTERVAKELGRRTVTEVPADLVFSYPWLDGLRTVLSRYSKNPILADIAWDAMSRKFDRAVARRHLRGNQIVFGFEYTARETFERARAEGIATVLAMPSLDSEEYEKIRERQEVNFPELRTKYHDYFNRRFPPRYQRRKAEIALADVIVANSELTKRSHVRAGADPAKIVSLPLAAPPPIETIGARFGTATNPLSVVWAGTFSVRKGAHHFLTAWRALRAGSRAEARVYGAIALPDRVLRPLPPSFELAGSVPQQELFAAFDRADVLAFPTLSDGFGMVVLEAFSRGVPVITTSCAGASEFVEHGKNGLIIPSEDPQELTNSLRWCLDNRDELFKMRFSALETARRWQWADYRQALVGVIEKRFGQSV